MGRIYFIKGGKRGGFIKEKADLLRKGGYSRKMAAFQKLNMDMLKKMYQNDAEGGYYATMGGYYP